MLKRGDIYYVSRDYTEVGHEERGGRPAVIVSTNDINNEGYGAIVCYMTTSPNSSSLYHCTVNSFNERNSVVLAETVRYVAASRIGNYAGHLSDEDMMKVEDCLALALDFNRIETEAADEGEFEEENTEEDENIRTENVILKRELAIYKELYSALLDKVTANG